MAFVALKSKATANNTLFVVIVPIHSNPDVDLESTATSYDHYIHPCRLSDSGNGVNGFTVITDENGTEIETLSNQIKVCCRFSFCRIVLECYCLIYNSSFTSVYEFFVFLLWFII